MKGEKQMSNQLIPIEHLSKKRDIKEKICKLMSSGCQSINPSVDLNIRKEDERIYLEAVKEIYDEQQKKIEEIKETYKASRELQLIEAFKKHT